MITVRPSLRILFAITIHIPRFLSLLCSLFLFEGFTRSLASMVGFFLLLGYRFNPPVKPST